MKKFVLFVMLMMSVVSVSAQRWSLTPEVGMTAVKRGGFSYIDEPGYTWNARWKIGVVLCSTGIFETIDFVREHLPDNRRSVGVYF